MNCSRSPGATLANRGARSHAAGVSAEEIVARDCERRGQKVIARRWRGQGGEIDLIAKNGETLVFIEVKKSHSFDAAVHRITERQMLRIQTAAEEFVGTQPQGGLSEMRFDVAVVDRLGRVQVIENAFGHF